MFMSEVVACGHHAKSEGLPAVRSVRSVHECCTSDMVLLADGKYRVNLREKKPLIKTVAIQYCTEHAPRNNEEEN